MQGKAYRYVIERVLGQGTFGITYLATTQVKVAGALGELETTMQVAVKEFFMKDINGREENTVTTGSKGGLYANYKAKFAREAENLSRLKHPHIVKVLEYFEANNTVYYVMEYVEGGSLEARIKEKGRLPEGECLDCVGQIASAVSYMHAHKMLHLDLKPGNVMLRKDRTAVLIDFGGFTANEPSHRSNLLLKGLMDRVLHNLIGASHLLLNLIIILPQKICFSFYHGLGNGNLLRLAQFQQSGSSGKIHFGFLLTVR